MHTTDRGRTERREFLEALVDLTRGPGRGAPRFDVELEAPLPARPKAATPRISCGCPGAETDVGGRRWCVPPSPGGAMPITGPGIAEIKPHSRCGLAGGLQQLRTAQPDSPRFLITYLPVDVTRGRAGAVQVFGAGFANIAAVPGTVTGLRGKAWAHLGRASLPPLIRFPPVEHGGFFGSAVEALVRTRFARKLLPGTGRTLQRGTGAQRPGPDVVYRELAQFYAELARELGGPGGR